MKNIQNVNKMNDLKFSDDEILLCKNDRKKLNELVQNSVGFVKKAIKGIYLTSNYDYEDKLQLGYLGFLRAVEKFQKNDNNDFYTFAYTCIRQYLYNEHAATKRAKRGYNAETDTYVKISSIDKIIGEEDNTTVGDMIEDETMNTYEQAFKLDSRLEEVLKILSPAQQYAFIEYFINGDGLKEIAERHGVSTARVGNLTKQVVKKIKERYTEAEFAEIIGLH